MKPEKQRASIAQAHPALGWWKDHENAWHSKNGRKMNNGDPLQDLDAMFEAEIIVFNKKQWHEYVDLLIKIQPKDQSPIRATAAQRAEAFLKTIGKWEEE